MTQLNPSAMEIGGSFCLVMALIHTFSVPWLKKRADRRSQSPLARHIWHFFSEVEFVFGIWAGVLLLWAMTQQELSTTASWITSLSFHEPLFVLAVMIISSSQPILSLVERLIVFLARKLPLPKPMSFYLTCMTLGPLLGSLITEPAAMTVVALLMLKNFYRGKFSAEFRYATLGLLFVSISVGGTLTHFAAPPILMVAAAWGWDSWRVFSLFGWKALLAVTGSTAWVTYRYRKELTQASLPFTPKSASLPFWVSLAHLTALALTVLNSHTPPILLGVLILFGVFWAFTREHQSSPKIREALGVAFFLSGLVILGSQQRWWLEPILSSLQSFALFLGAIGLTAITDNAAITFLGAQVPTLSEWNRYALVAGAIAGGGLTVIANAPNPAGYEILRPGFGSEGIRAIKLFRAALIPTLIASACFWFLP